MVIVYNQRPCNCIILLSHFFDEFSHLAAISDAGVIDKRQPKEIAITELSLFILVMMMAKKKSPSTKLDNPKTLLFFLCVSFLSNTLHCLSFDCLFFFFFFLFLSLSLGLAILTCGPQCLAQAPGQLMLIIFMCNTSARAPAHSLGNGRTEIREERCEPECSFDQIWSSFTPIS